MRASRLVAKVDSAAVQDGFELYLHGFIVADDGAWVVVQQGMNGARRQARRYHWLWDRAGTFVDEPHAAIEGRPVGDIVNLVDRRAADARGEMVGLARGAPDGAQVRNVRSTGWRACECPRTTTCARRTSTCGAWARRSPRSPIAGRETSPS